MSKADIKIVYSFKLKNLLELKGFVPLLETENPKKKQYKCWVYEATPAFLEAFDELVREG